jgi:hypothetical protein
MTSNNINHHQNDYIDVAHILASMNTTIKNRDILMSEFIQAEKNLHDANSNFSISSKTTKIVLDKFGINSSEYQYQLNRYLHYSNKKDEAEYKYHILKDKLKNN